jgi:hypothetical protein
MNRHGNDRSQRSTWRKGTPSFAQYLAKGTSIVCSLEHTAAGFLLLLVFAGNILVATIAWIIVRLVTG